MNHTATVALPHYLLLRVAGRLQGPVYYNNHLDRWFHGNRDAFDTALLALIDELNGTGRFDRLRQRRKTLANWTIPPDDWQTLTRGRCHQPPPRRGVPDWGERKRRFASLIAWVSITHGEHLLAPPAVLPTRGEDADNRLRHSLIHEWGYYQHLERI